MGKTVGLIPGNCRVCAGIDGRPAQDHHEGSGMQTPYVAAPDAVAAILEVPSRYNPHFSTMFYLNSIKIN